MTDSEDCLALIRELEEAGRKPDSFSVAFPYIHHFRESGGDASLKGFRAHCENHEIQGETNLNVYRRIKHIREQVDQFVSENPENTGVTSIRFQGFAKQAEKGIPF